MKPTAMFTRYALALFLLLAAGGTPFHAQQSASLPAELIDRAGQEGIYVHYNSNLLLTGEYLYFRLYGLSERFQGTSPLSKVAYIELLDENGQRRLFQKVSMKDGYGQGDFFIPTSLASGHYTLVAYTAYMRNWSSDTFFSDPLVIINPYTNNQRVFRGDESESFTENSQESAITPNAAGFELRLDKETYGIREKVNLDITSTRVGAGSYSLSVRQLSDGLSYGSRLSPGAYLTQSLRPQPVSTNGISTLPELRGEVFRGSLVPQDSGVGITDERIIFSLPGRQYEFRVIPVEADGSFTFSMNTLNLNSESIFQVLGGLSSRYEVEMDSTPSLNIDTQSVRRFRLDKNRMKDLIEERSIQNQVENAYFNVKPDTVRLDNSFAPVYGEEAVEYKLDEYTRFKTFKEVLVEIVDNAWIDTDRDGKQTVYIRTDNRTRADVGYGSLVIVDGIIVQDHRKLIEFDPDKIETIRLSQRQFVFGGQVFDGIFDVVTYEEDFLDSYAYGVNTVELVRPIPEKKYFRQDYSNPGLYKNIPDFRRQLLWEPDLRLAEETTSLSFYTSDIKGTFEVVLEGISPDLRPVKQVLVFEVE